MFWEEKKEKGRNVEVCCHFGLEGCVVVAFESETKKKEEKEAQAATEAQVATEMREEGRERKSKMKNDKVSVCSMKTGAERS